jgi:hypothetical protein
MQILHLIHIDGSHKLNKTPNRTLTKQNGILVEVVIVSRHLHAVEKIGRLDGLLPLVVDETMRQIFREEGTKVIYDCLESNSLFEWEEIAQNPEVFSAGLEKLLGSAAPVVERLILKNLYLKLGLRFKEKKGCRFPDYMKELKEKHEY